MTTNIQSSIPDKSLIKILIVDDDEIVLEVMKTFVSSYGFNFSTATDGLEAVKQLESDYFPIVITDINMPNMNGMELLKHVIKEHPKVGVIVVTGLSEEYSYSDVISAGAIDYMTKPFDGNELLAKLQRVLREQALVKELEQMTIMDALTTLYNRRHFDTKIKEELHRAHRQSYQVFLSFLDVDKFKGYNDTYGHQAGDNLLSTLGHIMINCARKSVDWPFRYGGDEFAFIIAQTNLEQAIKVNQRIMDTYKEHDFGETSLSCGITEFIRNPETPWPDDIKKFIVRADRTLYKAKEGGRDQIVCAS